MIIKITLCIDIYEDTATRWVSIPSIFTNLYCHLLDMRGQIIAAVLFLKQLNPVEGLLLDEFERM